MPNPKGHEDSIKDSRFKAAWQSGPTRTIRVPIALAEVTLEYARQLDKGIEPHDTAEMFDNGTDTVIVEPRDTMVQSDSPTHNKVDNIVTEPRDTAKIQAELESIRANYDALLETSARITTKLRDEVDRLRSALELPEASVLLNKLKAKRKKSTASLADVDAILEILEES
ncbi:hypothetical protein [Microcoleus sp. herbarium2]|uniref:hypothetical protein n=1 Tax=Microcoleus sp. herbarium2 TaxID=3055433 RepID=UPI002FCF8353